MSEPIKIAIVLEGGSVQAVLSAGVPVEFVIVDYDTEGGDVAGQIAIPQDGGGTAPAYGHIAKAEQAGLFVMAAFDAVAAAGRDWRNGQALEQCPICNGLGADPASGEVCEPRLGGGEE
jgi:hypothetical protein